jgi:hypothetical protein
MFSACLVKHVLESLDVVAPILAFRVIGVTDFPLTSWVIQSLLEPGELLFLGNVQEEFENRCVVFSDNQPLKIVDLIVTSLSFVSRLIW